MYFPFLRGKQYELLALREFSKDIKGSNTISPIIEPVRKEKKGIETALLQLISNRVNFSLITNPTVGEIESAAFILNLIENNDALLRYKNFQIGIHVFSEMQVSGIFKLIEEKGLSKIPLALIHNDIIANEAFIKASLNKGVVKFNILNETRIRAKRYKRHFDQNSLVILENPFISKEKNADYLAQEDEFFSDEYLIFLDEGYIGFSDFLTIGEDYSEAGFLPRAVAIHITYLADDESIRIRHFVSDSNDDVADTPGKFAEALQKLIEAIPELCANHKTKAIEEFEKYYADGHYPGLGSIKKLSILNHLQLMNHLL